MSIVKQECMGGIIIIPAGFFFSPRDVDVRCRDAFMKKYKANPNDPSMLAEYSSMVSKAADMEKSSKDCASDVKVAERITKIAAKMATAAAL